MDSRNSVPTAALYIMFALLVIGVRLMIVASYGNVTPVWDQWDAEIDRLYRPWLEGSLRWDDMFAAHNEHRVFIGRVLALLLFSMNGDVLNPMIEMVANAFVHVAALLLLLHGILKFFPDFVTRRAIAVFSTLFFSIPLGVENILVNNSAMYLLILFSILFFLALAGGVGGGKFRDAMVLLFGLLACLSFASGSLTLLAGVGFLGVQWWLGVRRNRSALILMFVLLVMAAVSIGFTPTIAAHGSLKSSSLIIFVSALFKMTGGFLFFVPAVLFMVRQLRKKPDPDDPSWFLFGLCIWIFGQMAVIAYGRGHSNVIASRYRDLYLIGYLSSLASLLVIMQESGSMRLTWLFRTWIIAFCLGIGALMPVIDRNLQQSAADGHEYETRVRSYLTKHDNRVLFEVGAKIPYPDPVRLSRLLDRKVVRDILPRELFGESYTFDGKHAVSFAEILYAIGAVLAGTGFGLFSYLLFLKNDIPFLPVDGNNC
jgi:hypothetical protein